MEKHTVLANVMREKGLANVDLAAMSNVSIWTVSWLKRGGVPRPGTKGVPHVLTRQALAAALEVEVGDLFDRDGRPRLVTEEESCED